MQPSLEMLERRDLPSIVLAVQSFHGNISDTGQLTPTPGKILTVDPIKGTEKVLYTGAAATWDGPDAQSTVAIEADGSILFAGTLGTSTDPTNFGQHGLYRVAPGSATPALVDAAAPFGATIAVAPDKHLILGAPAFTGNIDFDTGLLTPTPGKIVSVDAKTGVEQVVYAGAADTWDGPNPQSTIAVEADGSVLFVGTLGTSTDPTNFGQHGLYRISPGNSVPALLDAGAPFGAAVAVAPDKHVILAASSFTGNIDFETGLLTPTPGKVVSVDPASGAEQVVYAGPADTWDGPGAGSAVAVEADGGILFVGSVGTSNDPTDFGQHGVYRIPAGGSTPALLDGDAPFGAAVAVGGPMADIEMVDATTMDLAHFRKIDIKYSVAHADVPDGFAFRAYLSADATFDPSGDTQLAGELAIKPKDAKAGPGGEAKEYEQAFKLGQNVTVGSDARFILVVADADKKVTESDEENNALFVIPLFAQLKFGGTDKESGTFKFGRTERDASGPIKGRIARGTADFDNLTDITDVWQAGGGSFKDEEPTPYQGDDHRADPTLVAPLTALVALIGTAGEQGRLDGAPFTITEAFDEQGEHIGNATHFEGRAIDIRASGNTLERLAGLGLLAGFDWVYNEKNHLHVSHRGASATVSTEALHGAATYALDHQLILTQARYDALVARLAAVDELTKKIDGGTLTPKQLKQARQQRVKELNAFTAAVQQGIKNKDIVVNLPSPLAGAGEQKAAIGELLIYNARALRKSWG